MSVTESPRDDTARARRLARKRELRRIAGERRAVEESASHPIWVEEQVGPDGDVIWAVYGRGDPVLTYSIREVERVIAERLTPEELCLSPSARGHPAVRLLPRRP